MFKFRKPPECLLSCGWMSIVIIVYRYSQTSSDFSSLALTNNFWTVNVTCSGQKKKFMSFSEKKTVHFGNEQSKTEDTH